VACTRSGCSSYWPARSCRSQNFFIVNVALPTIGKSLHASAGELELVVAAYGVAYAALLVFGGRLGDRIGRHRLFQVGAAGFVAASAACGLAPGIWFLIIARLTQGATAAMLVPQVLATFHAVLDGERKTRALALYGATSGIAAVVGQLVGGLLVTADIAGSSWRPIFLINIPLGVAVLLIAGHVVPATRSEHSTSVDLPGTLLFGGTLVALLLPLSEGHTLGWPAWTWMLLGAALVLGSLTVAVERRSERAGLTPLLPPSLLKLPSMARGLAMILPFSFGFGAFMFIFALTVQTGLHADPLVGGLSILPMAALFLVGSIASPKIINRYGRGAIAAGALTQAAGLALIISVIVAAWPHVALIALAGPLALIGAGQSLLFAGLFRVVLTDVPLHHGGIGGGVLVTLQQAGLALGVATLGSIYLAFEPHSIPTAFAAAIGIQFVIALVLAAASRLLPRFTSPRRGGTK
jgi:MFS family permease